MKDIPKLAWVEWKSEKLDDDWIVTAQYQNNVIERWFYNWDTFTRTSYFNNWDFFGMFKHHTQKIVRKLIYTALADEYKEWERWIRK